MREVVHKVIEGVAVESDGDGAPMPWAGIANATADGSTTSHDWLEGLAGKRIRVIVELLDDVASATPESPATVQPRCATPPIHSKETKK